MTGLKVQLVAAMGISLVLVGCGSLGSRATPAPVEDPSQVGNPEQRVIVAPVPATRIAPTEKPHARSAQSGSALKKLRLAALTQQRSGKYAGAAATLERALRISPRDAKLWHQLAQVRLEQHKWRLAVNMAAKSNALASNQPPLQRKNWLIMAKAYAALGQKSKAKAARQRAK